MPTPSMTPEEQKAYDEALKRIEECQRKGEEAIFLDLSDLGLTMVPPEIGQLTKLRWLNLDNNQLRTLPSEIGQLSALTDLHLNNNQLSTLPPEIGELSALKNLHLHNNQLSTLPPEIGELSALTNLQFHNNQLSTLPPEIGQLSALTHLYLYTNKLRTLPPGICRLTALTHLHLSDNQLSTLPPEIGQLSALTHLYLSFNQLSTLPPEICQLNALTLLYLNNNQLSTLPSQIGQLTALEQLELFNNRLINLPPEIGNLRRLNVLFLHKNQLTSLPPEIGKLSKLKRLGIGTNQFANLLPEVGLLDSLEGLYLDRNQLSSLPAEIGKLAALKELRLEYNQLSSLPTEIRRINTLAVLYLHQNERLGLPLGLLGHTWEEVRNNKGKPASPKEILDYYFSQHTATARPLNEVKMMLVGRGGAGKTSLVERLMRNTFDKRQESTTGIALQDWRLPCPGGDAVTVHVWDFAGQVIAHATHQFFLSARSVYVLVLTAREDSQREDAEYWLRLIHAFGRDEDDVTSKVLVALNKWATAPVRLDREALREKYPFIVDFMETDCETGQGIAELKTKLAEIIGSDTGVREKTGADYFQVKETLQKHWKEQQTNYLDYSVFEEVCISAGVTDKDRQRIIARNLHRLGLALNYGDDERLRDTTVLNPHWVADGIYLLLRQTPNERAELSLDAACRKFPKDDPRQVMFLIRLMQKYDLVFPLKEDEQLWLVPQALADSQPVLEPEWQGEATRLRWTYSALPEGLVPRFITRTHTLSEGLSRWLNGTLLELGMARAVVRADVTDRRITATILGPEPDRQQLAGTIQTEMRSLNAEIRGLDPLEELQLQRAPEVWLPVTGLEKAEKKGTLKMDMLTPQGPVEISPTEENNRLTAPDARTDVWKPRVFISYSHKDDAAKDQLVLKLKVLQTAGLVEFWVDRDLTAGEEWNRGIKDQLEEMDVFVLLVSDHSLTSDYINRVEITRAMERRKQGTAEVVPVILHRCQWKACERLNHLIALPKDGKPIKDHRPQSLGWHDVSEGLMRVLTKLKQQHAGEHRSSERERGLR
ncbi:leucine-rich repeat domain-containing protein [Prosthecobacter sp.]|uniref:leucine-rich repeat domain-containing protein n=1 Tax=Prosthecobacter sp. TaxID=1965333 RepID=UPI0024892829|nr:leucine-rich repeat domain-containing protein [Prosthecobacter sp.]MDI1315373.1 COR domain-containing protein [Prosthecobacter sp.]